jgi:carbon storage regulator
MLILQRKSGESLFIGEDIQVTVVSVESGRVRLAIEAPRNLSILRSELRTAMEENRNAATGSTVPTELLSFLSEIKGQP